MEKPKVRISVRNLVEFILRSGDLDNSRGSSGDKEAMLKGGRLHRKIQRSMKGDYQAEVSLKKESEYDDVVIQVEGRADGIFTEDGAVYIDEIKGTYGNVQAMDMPIPVHRAQAMCYGMIWGEKAMPGYGLYDRALGAAYLRGLWEAAKKEGEQR